MKTQTVDIPGVTHRDLWWWQHTGLLDFGVRGSGTGNRRPYTPEQVRAIRALDALRRLGGIVPTRGTGMGHRPEAIALAHTVAHLARSNPPGSAHEITTPVPWIRHVLIVPEP